MSTELIIWRKATEHLPGYDEPVLAWNENYMHIAYLVGEQVDDRDDDRVWWIDSDGEEVDVVWWAEIKGPGQS